MLECSYEVRRRYAGDVANRAVVHEMLAADLFKIGRTRVDEGRQEDARKAFAHALRHASGAGLSANVRALTWVAVLSLPTGVRERAGRAFVGLSRALEGPDARRPARTVVSRWSTPSISVVVTVYNGEEYVAEALTSILGQTHRPDEVIVVDDGSTDGTARELERFAGDIRVIAQANTGHAGALNRGYPEARGDYIAKCDADDIWEPDKLSRQVRALVDHPEIDVAFSGARNFGLAEDEWVHAPGEGLLDPRELTRALLAHEPRVRHVDAHPPRDLRMPGPLRRLGSV